VALTQADPRRRAGFSLVELLVTMGVVVVVLGVTTLVLVESGRAFTTQQVVMGARNQNGAALDMMERLIRQAVTITADPDGNNVFDSIRLVGSAGPYQNVTFFANGGTLFLQEGGGVAVPFADGVTQLRFTYADHRGGPLTAALATGRPELIGMVRATVRAASAQGLPPVESSTNVAIRRVK
jgi:prepilin-type N-terminal cleavage/methylation domain-containing protein